MRELAEDQRDLIAETLNVGVGNAAARLSEIVGEEVFLSVPNVRLSSRQVVVEDFLERASSLGSSPRLVAVREKFFGDIGGEALLVFSEEEGHRLARSAYGLDQCENPRHSESDFLIEVGGAVLGSCLGAFAEALDAEIVSGVAAAEVDEPTKVISRSGEGDDLLFASVSFTLGEKSLTGQVLVIFDRCHIEGFLARIDVCLARLSRSVSTS